MLYNLFDNFNLFYEDRPGCLDRLLLQALEVPSFEQAEQEFFLNLKRVLTLNQIALKAVELVCAQKESLTEEKQVD